MPQLLREAEAQLLPLLLLQALELTEGEAEPEGLPDCEAELQAEPEEEAEVLPLLLPLPVALLHTEAELEREAVADWLPVRLPDAQLLPVLEAQEELEAEGEAEAVEFRDRVGAELALLTELVLGVELLEA